jgi:hypothetical protein
MECRTVLFQDFDVTTPFYQLFVECPVAGETNPFESLAQLMADSEGELSWPEYLKARVMSNITQSSIGDRLDFIQHSLLIRLKRHGNLSLLAVIDLVNLY